MVKYNWIIYVCPPTVLFRPNTGLDTIYTIDTIHTLYMLFSYYENISLGKNEIQSVFLFNAHSENSRFLWALTDLIKLFSIYFILLNQTDSIRFCFILTIWGVNRAPRGACRFELGPKRSRGDSALLLEELTKEIEKIRHENPSGRLCDYVSSLSVYINFYFLSFSHFVISHFSSSMPKLWMHSP